MIALGHFGWLSLILKRSFFARLYSLLSPSDIPWRASSWRHHIIVYVGPMSLRVRSGPWVVNMFIFSPKAWSQKEALLSGSKLYVYSVARDHWSKKVYFGHLQWDLRGTTWRISRFWGNNCLLRTRNELADIPSVQIKQKCFSTLS